MWEFLRDEWPYLVERFSLNDRYLFPFFLYSPNILLLILLIFVCFRYLGRMPKYISYTFSSQLRLDELLAFYKKYPKAGAGKHNLVLFLIFFKTFKSIKIFRYFQKSYSFLDNSVWSAIHLFIKKHTF